MTDSDQIQGPAILTSLHRQDRELSIVAGAPKGFRRIDRLQWLFDHNSIGQNQLDAGRRLQEDWQLSKLENSAKSAFEKGSAGGQTNLSDAKCDAIDRLKAAMAVIPPKCGTVLTMFLMPEDHPFSLEQIAGMVRRNPKTVSRYIGQGLRALAVHYGMGG